MLAILILSLCVGFISDAMGFGVKHLRERTKRAYAVVLLDILCAAVRNDLGYAVNYDAADHSFTRIVRDYEGKRDVEAVTWYGTGLWRADSPESYYDADAIQWREIHAADARPGQLIRKSELSGGGFFFDCVAPPETYSGYGEVRTGLSAGVEVLPPDPSARGVDFFTVSVRIYDADGGVLAQRKFIVIPVCPIAVRRE